MKKRVAVVALLAIVLLLPAFAVADQSSEPASWTGWVTDENCGAKGAKAEHKGCAESCVKRGARWAIYDATAKETYVLSNQKEAAAMAGQEVTVKGTLDKEKKMIEVTSMEAAAKK
jgi:hypothetical protein